MGVTRPPGLERRRLPVLGLSVVALLAGLGGALVLLGLPMPAGALPLAATHGVLMTLGFLGTLIALERAVALGRTWGYAAPVGAGLGAMTLVLGLPVMLGAAFLVVGGAAFVLMYVAFDRIEAALHTRVQGVGAVAWLVAAVLWLSGRSIGAIVAWLAAFLILTVVGERLELSRLGRPSSGARRGFILSVGVFCGGVVLTLVAPGLGTRIAGAGLVALAAWLWRNDLARRTVRTPGVTRFIAVCLLTGYAWLAVGGAAWIWFGAVRAGFAYDIMLHALFLGFVISMVFGHAPVILPAILRIPLPYRERFYAHLLVLHAGLLIRVVGGDLLGSTAAWQAGGVLNVTALLVFLVSSAIAAIGALWRRRPGAMAARALREGAR